MVLSEFALDKDTLIARHLLSVVPSLAFGRKLLIPFFVGQIAFQTFIVGLVKEPMA
jgi:hypothetical protein